VVFLGVGVGVGVNWELIDIYIAFLCNRKPQTEEKYKDNRVRIHQFKWICPPLLHMKKIKNYVLRALRHRLSSGITPQRQRLLTEVEKGVRYVIQLPELFKLSSHHQGHKQGHSIQQRDCRNRKAITRESM